MTDELRDLFSASVPAAPPAAGQADAARARARTRRRTGAAAAAALAVAVIVPSALIAQHLSEDGPEPADGVDCAEVVVTEPYDRPRNPAYATPRAAVSAWAGPGNDAFVRMKGDHEATLVGEDGSVRARVRVESAKSEDTDAVEWSVDGSTVCADEISDEEWGGAALLDCVRGNSAEVHVRYEDDRDRTFPSEPGGLRVEREDRVGIPALTPGARSGDATTVTTRNGRAAIVVREVRVDDLWRIDRIAACDAHIPNLEGGGWSQLPERPAVRVFLGHCDTAPLRMGGQTWVPVEADDLGWGDGRPPHWFGFGMVTGGDVMRYLDLGGHEMTFVPQGSPDAATLTEGCA